MWSSCISKLDGLKGLGTTNGKMCAWSWSSSRWSRHKNHGCLLRSAFWPDIGYEIRIVYIFKLTLTNAFVIPVRQEDRTKQCLINGSWRFSSFLYRSGYFRGHMLFTVKQRDFMLHVLQHSVMLLVLDGSTGLTAVNVEYIAQLWTDHGCSD